MSDYIVCVCRRDESETSTERETERPRDRFSVYRAALVCIYILQLGVGDISNILDISWLVPREMY